MKRTRRNRSMAAALLLTALLAGAGHAKQAKLDLPYRWMFASTRFQDDERVNRLIGLLERAKRAGYNGVRLIDGRWGRMTGHPPNFYANIKRVREAAERIGTELMPCIGHYMIMSDPNVAEALAAKDTPFVVKGGKAYPEEKDLIAGGDFDRPWTAKPHGFESIDLPGVCTFHDAAVKRSGAGSLRLESFPAAKANRQGHHLVRAVPRIRMEPWTQYVFEMWVKTKDVDPVTGVHPTVWTADRDHRSIMPGFYRVKATGDWQVLRWVFNSLQYREAVVSVSAALKKGTVWFDDVSIRRTGGINLVRRDGCPVKVTSEDGKTVYEEGRDFEPWADPLLANRPNKIGRWHEPPPIVLTRNSRIREGQRLRVSYYHTVRIGKRDPGPCLRSELFFKYWEEMVRFMHENLGARRFHMMHNSELRIAGQCGLCRKEGETVGQVLAENTNRCLAIIRRIVPDGVASVSNDMFDPNHHARGEFYALSGGSMTKAWEIDPSIVVSLWFARNQQEPIRFFSGRGHPVVINTYYDYKGWDVALRNWLDSARQTGGVKGIMFTTFVGNYDDLEAFSRIVDEYVK